MGNKDVAKEKLLVSASVAQHVLIKLYTFLSCPLQNNNVKSPKFTWSVEGNYSVTFTLKLNANYTSYAEDEVWRR